MWGGISLINYGCGRPQATVGSVAPGQIVLGCTTKQTEQVRCSKAVSSVPLWLLLPILPQVFYHAGVLESCLEV